MKIRDIEKWTDEYYPKKEKSKEQNPAKKIWITQKRALRLII